MQYAAIVAIVIAASALSACQTDGWQGENLLGRFTTQATNDSPAEPGSPASERVSLSFYTPFYDQTAHLGDLLEKGDTKAALQLITEQEPYFEANVPKAREPLSRAAESLNSEKVPALRSALQEIDDTLGNLAPEGWQNTKELLVRAAALWEGYPNHFVLKRPEFQSPEFAQLGSRLANLSTKLRENAAEAFANFDHFGARSFFDAYPIDLVDRQKFISSNFASLEQRLANARVSQIEQFAGIYPAIVLGKERWSQLGSHLFVAYSKETPRASDRDLRSMLDNLHRVQKAGFPTDAITSLSIAFVEVTSQTLLKEGQIQFPAQIQADLPAKLSKSDLDDAFKSGSESDYVVVFDVALAKASRKVTGSRKKSSRFVSGRQTEPNPDYNIVQNELNNARMELSTAAMNKAGVDAQFCYGVGCLGKAISQIAAGAAVGKSQENVQAAMARLRATSMTVEKPIYQEYRYDLANVDARKVMTVNYYVIDRRRSSYFKSTFDIEERKNFEVAYQIHPNDPSKEQHVRAAATEKDVIRWEEAPSSVKLTQLIDHYLANVRASKPLPSSERLRAEMLQDKNLALARFKEETFVGTTQADPRFDSVVVVFNPDGKLGSGFFIAPDIVLTNYHVVEERNFVELKLYGGAETFGKVIARDVRLDLALIRVQSRGKPVRFFESNKLELGSTVEVIGHPKGLEFSITRGVVSAVREMPNVNINDSRKVLTVQIDAPVNHGNSGGPVFLKDRVVGVVSFGAGGKDIQNLNFTVHYSEALKFIKESTNAKS